MQASSSHYRQLQPEERITITSLKQQSYSVRAIARQLRRSPSTISRELERNACPSGYGSAAAQRLCLQCRPMARPALKLHPDSILFDLVAHLLRLHWSPEQIALTLTRLYPPGHEYRVSHETIYNCIYAMLVGELRKELMATLRHAHNKRLPRSKGTDRRGQIPDMLSIHVRPSEIEVNRLHGPPTYSAAAEKGFHSKLLGPRRNGISVPKWKFSQPLILEAPPSIYRESASHWTGSGKVGVPVAHRRYRVW